MVLSLQLESLPHRHSDPFDRLLIAQALTESLPILESKIWKADGKNQLPAKPVSWRSLWRHLATSST
jgi:hypothetical protein